MKKIVFLISVLVAALVACVPAPVKAQGIPHQYNVATPTTPIGRYIVSGDKLWVKSTGQILEVTASFISTATPASIVTSGSYKYFPSGNAGLNTLTPTANGSGSVGTSGLHWGTGYINAFTATTVTATGGITTSAGGYFGYGTNFLADSSFYFPSRTSGAASWLSWNLREAGTPKCRMSLQNMANYSIQDKASTGQVAIIVRDTTLATATAKLNAISRVVFVAATDTTTKTAGSIVYRGGFFWGCDGTYYYKLTN